MRSRIIYPCAMRRQQHREWTEADNQRLRELALAGNSTRQIAMELNRNVISVRYRCGKLGLAMRLITLRRRVASHAG